MYTLAIIAGVSFIGVLSFIALAIIIMFISFNIK